MTQLYELACPEVSTGAGFHADQARRPIHKELDELRAPELLAHHNLTSLINAVHLEESLCQIYPRRRNVHLDAPLGLSGCHNTSTLARTMPCRVGASMPLLLAPESREGPIARCGFALSLSMFFL